MEKFITTKFIFLFFQPGDVTTFNSLFHNSAKKHESGSTKTYIYIYIYKQMEKINQRYGLDDPAADAGDALGDVAENPLGGDGALEDSGEVLDGANDALDEVARKLTGRENALSRQLLNEERKLAKRMEAVERMRQLAEQTGDDGMLEAADRLEEWAGNHFDQRMAQITDFQQRHDLPDISQYLSP